MELIKEIYEDGIGIKNRNVDISYKVRKASRTILLNQSQEIALLYVSKGNYHKLPGGGIEDGEDLFSGLQREVDEEVGAKIEILDDIGVIIEYRDDFNQLQISYCFYSKVSGKIKETSFTEHELAKGFELKWVPFDEVLNIIKKDKPNSYVGHFIHQRDLDFIKKAREIINV